MQPAQIVLRPVVIDYQLGHGQRLQERPEIAQTVEVAEHVREEDEAPDPERADQPGDGRRAERAAADDVPEGEETRLQQRDDRHGVSSPSAALTMSRKTASSDAGSGPPSP